MHKCVKSRHDRTWGSSSLPTVSVYKGLITACLIPDTVNQIRPNKWCWTLRADQRPDRQPYASSCTSKLKSYPDPLTFMHREYPMLKLLSRLRIQTVKKTNCLKDLNGSSTEEQLRHLSEQSETELLFPTCHSNFHCSKWWNFHYCSV